MKHIYILISLIILSSVSYAQTEDWLWAQQSSSVGDVRGHDITIDSSGNSFVTGYFTGSATFGTTTITSNASNYFDIFVAKLDTNGNYLWVTQAECGTYWLWYTGSSIAVDIIGNCYVTGYFIGTATFGTTTLVSSGSSDIYVAKLDTNGNWLWAKRAGGTHSTSSQCVTTDSNGSSYITGSFTGTSIFGTTTLVSSGDSDTYVAKLDSLGSFLWAQQAGSTGSDSGYGITTDSSRNSYITGSFSSTSTFGLTTLVSSGSSDIFVAKLDSLGNFLWAQQAGSIDYDIGYGINTDSSGNCYITGNFSETATFGTTVIISRTWADNFVAKLDTNGNYLWAKQGGGSFSFSSMGWFNPIATDSSGNTYVSGSLVETATFGTTELVGNGGYEIYIAKMDTDGVWLWAKRSGGTSMEQFIVARGLAIDSSGDCFVTGHFSGTATVGMTTLTSNESSDIFIAKIGSIHTVLAPNGGENWLANSTQTVSWSFINTGSYVNVLLSVDNGINWIMLNSGPVLASLGSFSFNVPATPSYQCLIKVVSTVNSNMIDTSDAQFSIVCQEPYAMLSASQVSFGNVWLNHTSTISFTINNYGLLPMDVDLLLSTGAYTVSTSTQETRIARNSLINDQSNLVVRNEINLIIPELAFQTVYINFLPTLAQNYLQNLLIETNAINLSSAIILLSGTGIFVPPLPPDNVQIVMDGSNAVISWDAVTETADHTTIVPDYYLVFFNDSGDLDDDYYYLGWTESLSYTHRRVGLHSAIMFYRVWAYKYYERGDFDVRYFGLKLDMREVDVHNLLGHKSPFY